MVSFMRYVSCGIDAGKFFEVVNKMRLIEISAAGRHVYPGKICIGPNILQHLLKAPNSGKEFWRKSNFIREELDETARADANVIGKISHGWSGMNIAEEPERAIDRTMPFQRLERLFQQALFKHLKFLLRRLRFQQALPQQSCFMSPQLFKGDV